MKKIYLITILLLMAQISFACSCSFFWANEAIIKDLSANSDLVVVGHPIKNIDSNFISDNPKYMGTMILFKVESVLKGELKSDTIFINQETMRNCSQHFMPNEKYVIFGNQIKNYETVKSDDYSVSTDYSKKSKTLKFRDPYNQLVVFENLTKKILYHYYQSMCLIYKG